LRVGERQAHTRREPRTEIDVRERVRERGTTTGSRAGSVGYGRQPHVPRAFGRTRRPSGDTRGRRVAGTLPSGHLVAAPLFEAAVGDSHWRPRAIYKCRQFDAVVIGRLLSAREWPRKHADGVVGDGAFDDVLGPVSGANGPVLHVVEEAELLVRPIDAEP